MPGMRNTFRRVGHQENAIIRDDDDEMRDGRRRGEDFKNALNEYPEDDTIDGKKIQPVNNYKDTTRRGTC
jgi:hypothetical protein